MHEDNIWAFRTYYDMGYRFRKHCGSVVPLTRWGTVCPPPPSPPPPDLTTQKANTVRCLFFSIFELDKTYDSFLDRVVSEFISCSTAEQFKYILSREFEFDVEILEELVRLFSEFKIDIENKDGRMKILKHLITSEFELEIAVPIDDIVSLFFTYSHVDEFKANLISLVDIELSTLDLFVVLFKNFKGIK